MIFTFFMFIYFDSFIINFVIIYEIQIVKLIYLYKTQSTLSNALLFLN